MSDDLKDMAACAATGAAVGAAMGSFIPVIGTWFGGLAGAHAGQIIHGLANADYSNQVMTRTRVTSGEGLSSWIFPCPLFKKIEGNLKSLLLNGIREMNVQNVIHIMKENIGKTVFHQQTTTLPMINARLRLKLILINGVTYQWVEYGTSID